MITATPDHVDEHRDVVGDRQQVRAQDVDRRLDREDDREQQEGFTQYVFGVPEVDAEDLDAVKAEHDVQERGRRVDDRGDDADQADQVEPAREPAPHGAAQARCPPVDPAGRRVLGDDLRDTEADDQDRDRDQDPAPGDRDRAAVVPRLPIGRKAAGEDRDDRERDREVGERAPGSLQVLAIAHLRELSLIFILELLGVGRFQETLSPRQRPIIR